MTLRVFVKANADLVDATLSRSDGGTKLDRGVRELIGAGFPDVNVEVAHEGSAGFSALRSDLEAGTSSLIEWQPNVVLLSIADDVRSLGEQGANPEEATRRVREDLEAVVGAIKEKVGAHVLVANASTVDPADGRYTYYEMEEEPPSLKAQRLDLALVLVSHDVGISIIDVDRLVAEIGGGRHVKQAMAYDAEACATIAAEVVRIIEDYGFLDDRPLLAQVGARGSAA